jgi:hypothetical protein
MSFCSSSVSARFTFAGEPRTKEPGGIFVPRVTKAFAPMIERAPISIKNDCPHPDEDFVVVIAGVDDGTVTDGDELAKPRLVRRIDVNDGIVQRWARPIIIRLISPPKTAPRTIHSFLPSTLRRR